MAARWLPCFLLPLLWENYWSDLNQTLHRQSPYGLVVQDTIFFSFAYSIWPPRRPFLNFLLPPVWEYYWSHLNQTLHTPSPYDLVVQHTILSSFAYSIWPPGGCLVFKQNFLLPLLWENYWLDLDQILRAPFPDGLVVQHTIFRPIRAFNMAAGWPCCNFLLTLLEENYWSDLDRTLHTPSPYDLDVQHTIFCLIRWTIWTPCCNFLLLLLKKTFISTRWTYMYLIF